MRREDKNPWERRVPLTPSAVGSLVRNHGVAVTVQPSPIRVFADQDYAAAGATVQEDLSDCPLVLAVKEIPKELLQADRAYVFFSHTIKGQPYNMDLLRRLVELRCTLIDYECIVDDTGRRLVFFGRHAGLAGMIDTLWVLGRRLLVAGHRTPLADLKLAFEYPNLAAAKEAISVAGERLRAEPLPQELAPLVVGFAGYGNVSSGAQEILDLLPVESVRPEELARVATASPPPRDRLFKVVFHERDLVAPREEAGRFELHDYYQHPEKYRSIFEAHARHLTVLVNAIFWTDKYPRLVTNEQLARWFSASPQETRLKVIADISCDINGSVQCTTKATTPGSPVYVYDPATGRNTDGYEGEGLAMMTTDCLPCELPAEASESFTNSLLPYVPAMASADWSLPFDQLDLPAPIKRAVVLSRGELTPPFRYMEKFLA